MVWNILLFMCFIVFTIAVKIPHYIKPCPISKEFNKCALEHAKYAMPYLLKGDDDLKIPPMSPFKVTLVDLKGSEHFRLKLKNMEVYGLDRINITDIRANFETKTLVTSSTLDSLTIVSDYEISGKILVFPLTGEGKAHLALNNGFYQYNVTWDYEVRDEKVYIHIIDSNYDYVLGGMTFNFENMFNGDKMLGAQMNKFLNENWELVNVDLKNGIVETLLSIHNDIAKKIFSQIPFDELFDLDSK